MAKPRIVSLDQTWLAQTASAADEIVAHLDALYRFALRLTADADQAQELTQETVLRAWQHRSMVVRDWRAWLFQTLYHTFISNHRRRLTQQEWSRDLAHDEAALFSPVSLRPSVITGEDVRNAIEVLPEELRVVVWLSDAEGVPLREIAQMLDWPLGTVASRLWRARQELRRLLSVYGPPKENPA